MLDSQVKLRDKVKISSSCEYHTDFNEDILTIVAIEINDKDNTLSIALRDQNGFYFDGWSSRDLIRVEDSEDMDSSTLKKNYCSVKFDDEDFFLCRVYCHACTNDFFVRQIHENKPSSCPYCGVKFTLFESHRG